MKMMDKTKIQSQLNKTKKLFEEHNNKNRKT